MRAIAIDFDGCLCADAYPFIGTPNWGVINKALEEQAAGAGLILWTCREGALLREAVTACESWGIRFDAVNENLPSWIAAIPEKLEQPSIGMTVLWLSETARCSMMGRDIYTAAVKKYGIEPQLIVCMEEMAELTKELSKNIGGATAQEQSNAMVQLTQAMAAGALRGEELNSILDAAPGIARAIEQYIGVAEGSIKQYAAEGLVTADVVKNALFSVADETNTKFESMPMTWAQVWTMMSNIALQALEPVLTFINWLANNIEIIGPIVLGVAAALGVYLIATKGVAAATKVWSAVQAAFNAVMALNPVFLIIMGIILLIALIYAVVAAVNKVTGQNISATGLICGALAVAAAFIGNLVIGLLNGIIQWVWTIFVEPFLGIVEWILNVCNGGFDSFGGAVANLIGNIISWFLSLGKVVTKIIDAIFGTDWTSGLSALQDNVLAWGKTENSITLDRDAPTIDHRFEYGDAWDSGYDFGVGIEDSVGGMFNMGDTDTFDMSGMMGDVSSIAGDTGSMADSLSATDEELEYLRDIAERDAINRFTTAEVKIDMTGMTNKIDGSVDLDGVITELTDGFTAALITAAEGVHE